MSKTKIEWVINEDGSGLGKTWNPIRGCSRISEGCRNCYAENFAARFCGVGQAWEGYADRVNGDAKWTGKVSLIEKKLNDPKKWQKPTTIFVNSMSDIFHEKLSFEDIEKVFKVMNDCPRHTFQVLTKRSARLLELSGRLNWTGNIWMGVSVEEKKVTYRIEELLNTPAKIKFVSFEPLIGEVGRLNLRGIDWAIVGGESGAGCREMKKEWAHSIRKDCLTSGTAFFFKQWGGVNKKKKGRLLDGVEYSELPFVG